MQRESSGRFEATRLRLNIVSYRDALLLSLLFVIHMLDIAHHATDTLLKDDSATSKSLTVPRIPDSGSGGSSIRREFYYRLSTSCILSPSIS